MGKARKTLDQSLVICWCTATVCDTAESASLPRKPVVTSSPSTGRTRTCWKQLFPSITLSKQRKFGADVVPGLFANYALTGTFPHYILPVAPLLSGPEQFQKIYLLDAHPSRSEVRDTQYLEDTLQVSAEHELKKARIWFQELLETPMEKLPREVFWKQHNQKLTPTPSLRHMHLSQTAKLHI